MEELPCVYGLGGKPVVNGIDSPVVVFVDEEIGASFVDHGFDGEHHAGNQDHLAAFRGYVADKRFFVEIKPDAVAADVFDYGIAVFPGMGMDAVPPRCPQGLAALSPRSTHSWVTRTSLAASGEMSPMVNIRDASE